jgi:hypothetical protein
MYDHVIAKTSVLGGIAKGVVPPSLVVFAEAIGYIDERSAIPLTLLFGACGILWYLQGRLTKIEVHMEDVKTHIEDLKDEVAKKKCPDTCIAYTTHSETRKPM